MAQAIGFKKNKNVYLFDGQLKANQDVQFAVIDISKGNKDLQQCADAIIRLRAEYFYANKQFSAISFWDNDKRCFKLGNHTDRKHFDEYLEKVFVHCGTISLSKQLKQIKINEMKIGDVLIKGGSPGHAMIVMDMAINPSGKIIYILAQSYMPAQDIHIVKNSSHEGKDAWYELSNEAIFTPEWKFYPDQLKTW